MQTIQVTSNIEVFSCWVCGTPMALTTDLASQLRETDKEFYCPNGHRLSFGPSCLAKKLATVERALSESLAREAKSGEVFGERNRLIISLLEKRIARLKRHRAKGK